MYVESLVDQSLANQCEVTDAKKPSGKKHSHTAVRCSFDMRIRKLPTIHADGRKQTGRQNQFGREGRRTQNASRHSENNAGGEAMDAHTARSLRERRHIHLHPSAPCGLKTDARCQWAGACRKKHICGAPQITVIDWSKKPETNTREKEKAFPTGKVYKKRIQASIENSTETPFRVFHSRSLHILQSKRASVKRKRRIFQERRKLSCFPAGQRSYVQV